MPTNSNISYCKIFPGIGIARLGNSPLQDENVGWFIGPEEPGTAPHLIDPNFTYRDPEGRIMRQGARFRVYAYDADDNLVCELTNSAAQIDWNCQLANKKASWFNFSGTKTALDTLDGNRAPDKNQIRNSDVGSMTRRKGGEGSFGNYYNISQNRQALNIVSDVVEISGKNKFTIKNNKVEQYGLDGFFKKKLPVKLGELRTDSEGRLIVLGGHGKSDAVDANGESIRDDRWILNYANNDDWYDDVSDGFVKVEVTLRSNKQEIPLKGAAWVIVAPPNYALDVQSIVTLYDVMEEVVHDVSSLEAPGAAAECRSQDVYYDEHIRPILKSMLDTRWVNAQALRGHGVNKPGDVGELLDGALADPCDPDGAEERGKIFNLLRIPYYRRPAVANSDKIREGNEAQATEMATNYYMPPLSGDQGGARAGNPDSWLSVTYLQYKRLEAWRDGHFKNSRGEKNEKSSKASSAAQKNIDPHTLTRTALEQCCGGAFFPGIEMTCSARHPKIYSEAFRLNDAVLNPGDLTKYMACPWQADFYECSDNWWPAQRPDVVLVDEDLDDIFDNFEEETKTGSNSRQFEQTLFKRKKWTRGLGTLRPSGKFLDSRLMPEIRKGETLQQYKDRDDGLAAQLSGYYGIGLRRLGGAGSTPEQEWEERIQSPWRLQFLTQDAIDRFSGRYFKISLPSPEGIFAAPTAKLLEEIKAKDLPDMATIRDNWPSYRSMYPDRAAVIVRYYQTRIREDIDADVKNTLTDAASTLDKGKSTAEGLKAFLEKTSVGRVEGDNPGDFDAKSDAYKQTRMLELMTVLRDIAYLVHRDQSGDMEMVDDWKDLGIVLTRKLDRSDEGEKTASIEVQAEVGRGKYDGVSARDAFYYLMNIEKFPDFRPTAKKLAEKFLAEGRKFIDEGGLQDPGHPESFVAYSQATFEAKLEQIYEIWRAARDGSTPWSSSRTRRETELANIRFTGPFNQTDGSWLRNIAKTGTMDEVRSLLFQIWSDEIGEGDPAMHHANIFTNLMRHLGHWPADVSTRDYANDERFDDNAFVGAIVPLAISEHTESYYPEIIGMTLFLEWEVLSLAGAVKRWDYMGIPSLFLSLHVGIDNATNGHGYQAKRAVEIYLDNINAESGPKAMQAHWKRIWTGFATFALAGGARYQNDSNQDDGTIERARLDTPENRVKALMRRKQPYGNLNHFEKRLGDFRINDLFENPSLFVRELAQSSWVVPGDPENSRLLKELTSYSGPMFKIFDKEDLEVWRDWIVWLGEEGGTSTPKIFVTKAESMLLLLTELREKAMTVEAHSRYSVTVPGKKTKSKKVPPRTSKSIQELFDQSDLTEVMRALRDPLNPWVVCGRPDKSPLVREFLAPSRPMGRAVDRRFEFADNRIGRIIVIEWIEAGCPIPGEPLPPEEHCAKPKKTDRIKMMVDQYWDGAVH